MFKCGGGQPTGRPPPLPVKRRTSSVYDNHSNQTANDSEQISVRSASPSPRTSQDASLLVTPPQDASESSPDASGTSSHSAAAGRQLSSHHVIPVHLHTSPRSRSPASSISSALSGSSEDLLDDGSSQTSSLNASPTKSHGEPRFSQYDNFSMMPTMSGFGMHGINDFTEKIQQLTSDIQSKSATETLFERMNNPPPLPGKSKPGAAGSPHTHPTQQQQARDKIIERGPNTLSTYDNLSPSSSPSTIVTYRTASMQGQSQQTTLSSLPGGRGAGVMRASHSAHQGFSGGMSTTVTGPGMMTYRASTSTAMVSRSMHMEISQETFSSSETFSSGGSSSMESLTRAPPLPPKKKHGLCWQIDKTVAVW